MKLWPFFSFYGGKWRSAPRYPVPVFPTIIEPFAGSAGYSVRHYDRNVILVDVDPIIVGVWNFLIAASRNDILSLPSVVDHVDDIHSSQEAKWLVGFWLNKGSASPRLSPSTWMRSGVRPKSHWGAEIKERIASQLYAIRHWRVIQGDYTQAPSKLATWFIDPPYDNVAGRAYRHRIGDYASLADWCRTRPGQVIVCEQTGSKWLPFEPLGVFKSQRKTTAEAVFVAANERE